MFDDLVNGLWGTVGFGRLAVLEKQEAEKARKFLRDNWADQPKEDLLKDLGYLKFCHKA